MQKHSLFKKLLLLAFILPSLQINALKSFDPWVYVDFDTSMLTRSFPNSIRITKQVIGIDGAELYSFFKKLYDKNNLSNIQPQSKLKIPKYVHQIWLGGALPEAFKQLVQTWQNELLGAGWSYKLWTDEDVKTFGLYNQEFYDETDSVGVKSDILKWEIIYRYGGVYADTDFECLKSLEILHYTYDFYTGIQPLDTQFLQLGAALYGAVPQHPILKHCIETIKDDWHKKGAPSKTGPVHFTKSFYVMADKDGSIDIALPASYFYPLGCEEKESKRTEWLKNGAYAIHHWAKSWMPAKYRLKEFKKLNNDDAVRTWND